MSKSLILSNITKVYETRNGPKTVLNNVNLIVNEGEKLGILGRNGAGKSTLVRLISGAEHATHGTIKRGMSISWPLAFSGAFQGSLTGIDNIKFICRVYGVSIKPVVNYVEAFSELGEYLKEPVKKYSSGMAARLAFGISMAIEFDCFLIDEIMAVGDARFQEKCHVELFEKRKDRSMIIVTHHEAYIKAHCNRAAVLKNGVLHSFDDIDEAYNFYVASEVT